MPSAQDRFEARSLSVSEMIAVMCGIFRHRSNAFGTSDPAEIGPAAVLSLDPLVVYTSPSAKSRMGLATVLRGMKDRPATFLIAVYGSIETTKKSRRWRRAAAVHRRLNPDHRIITLCNTEREAEMLRQQGDAAIFLNHNFLIGTDDFFPVADSTILYDAVYNARLSRQKRHHLSLEVETCAMIFYRTWMEDSSFERSVIERHGKEASGHRFINEIGPDGPVFMSSEAVNAIYNQARTGLCLSASEGAMYSSIEYMLSGLPVVSTPSLGGRDVYFDPDYCIVTDADPAAIRKAVDELKARDIPRDYIRARTLEKINKDRERFLDFLDGLSVPLPADALQNWPFRSKMVEWKPWGDYVADIEAGRS